MRTKEEISELINHIQTKENREIKFDEEAILKAYSENDNHQTLAIKILSIFGGFLASSIFVGFLFLAGLYDSEFALLLLGFLLIVFGAFINQQNDNTIVDTVSISAYIIGFILLGMGFSKMELDENTISLIFIFIAFCTLFLTQAYIISFVSVLIISGSFLTLLISNDYYDLVHVYVSVMAVLLSLIFLNEAKLLNGNSKISKLYSPVRIALLFSFLAGLIILGKTGILKLSQEYLWISSISIVIAIFSVVSRLLVLLNIHENKWKIYALATIVLLPTLFAPSISGAILIILLSFLVNYKTSLVIGAVVFIYFVSQYYYDLHYTLLTKSIVMFCSGILFLGLFFLTQKKLK